MNNTGELLTVRYVYFETECQCRRGCDCEAHSPKAFKRRKDRGGFRGPDTFGPPEYQLFRAFGTPAPCTCRRASR